MPSRRTLQVATSVLGLGAVIAAIAMFAKTLSPAADKQRPFLDIDIESISPGSFRIVQWKGKPLVVVRVTKEMLTDMQNRTSMTWSRRPISNEAPAVFVFSMISTNRGCGVKHAPKATRYPSDEQWMGGFFDPCHFGEWDYAGRAIKRFADQTEDTRLMDLEVPRYEFRSASIVRIH